MQFKKDLNFNSVEVLKALVSITEECLQYPEDFNKVSGYSHDQVRAAFGLVAHGLIQEGEQTELERVWVGLRHPSISKRSEEDRWIYLSVDYGLAKFARFVGPEEMKLIYLGLRSKNNSRYIKAAEIPLSGIRFDDPYFGYGQGLRYEFKEYAEPAKQITDRYNFDEYRPKSVTRITHLVDITRGSVRDRVEAYKHLWKGVRWVAEELINW